MKLFNPALKVSSAKIKLEIDKVKLKLKLEKILSTSHACNITDAYTKACIIKNVRLLIVFRWKCQRKTPR